MTANSKMKKDLASQHTLTAQEAAEKTLASGNDR